MTVPELRPAAPESAVFEETAARAPALASFAPALEAFAPAQSDLEQADFARSPLRRLRGARRGLNRQEALADKHELT
jgi:hypothetical protein